MSLDRLPDSAIRNVDSEIRKAERPFCERLSEVLKPLDPFQASLKLTVCMLCRRSFSQIESTQALRPAPGKRLLFWPSRDTRSRDTRY